MDLLNLLSPDALAGEQDPHGEAALTLMKQLCTSSIRAEAISRGYLTSNLVQAVVTFSSLSAEQLQQADRLQQELRETKDAAEKQVSAVAQETSSRSDDDDDDNNDGWFVEEPDPTGSEAGDTGRRSSSVVPTLTKSHRDRVVEVIGTLSDFVQSLCTFPSICLELVDSNSFGLLFRLLVADTADQEFGSEQQRISLEWLLALNQQSIAQPRVISYMSEHSCVASLMGVFDRLDKFSPIHVVKSLKVLVKLLRGFAACGAKLQQFETGYDLVLDIGLWLMGQIHNEEYVAKQIGSPNALLESLISVINDLVFIGHCDDNYQTTNVQAVGLDPALRVCNPPAFRCLQLMFLQLPVPELQAEVLNQVLMILSNHPDNFHILHELRPVAFFVEQLPGLNLNLKRLVFRVFEFIVVEERSFDQDLTLSLQAVRTLVLLLEPLSNIESKNRGQNSKLGYPDAVTVRLIFDRVHQFIRWEPAYRRIFRDAGLVDSLVHHLRALSKCLQASSSAVCGKTTQSRTNDDAEAPLLRDALTYKLAIRCLLALLENNSANISLFREAGGSAALSSLLRNATYRPAALLVLSSSYDPQTFSDLMDVLQSSSTQPDVQAAVIRKINSMLHDSKKGRDLWLNLNGFEVIFSILSSLNERFSPNRSWEENLRYWSVLDGLCATIRLVITEHPKNRVRLWSQQSWKLLASAVQHTGVLSTRLAPLVLQRLLDIATETDNTGHDSIVFGAQFPPVLSEVAIDSTVGSSPPIISGRGHHSIESGMVAATTANIDQEDCQLEEARLNNLLQHDDDLYQQRMRDHLPAMRTPVLPWLLHRTTAPSGGATNTLNLPPPILYNPEALLVALKLASLCPLGDQLRLFHSISWLLGVSREAFRFHNQELLSKCGILGFILRKYYPFVADPSVPCSIQHDPSSVHDCRERRLDAGGPLDRFVLMQSCKSSEYCADVGAEHIREVVTNVVEGLASHFVNSNDLKRIFKLMPWRLPVLLTKLAAAGSPTSNHLEFDVKATGFAGLEIPTFVQSTSSEKDLSVSPGYTLACWAKFHSIDGCINIFDFFAGHRQWWSGLIENGYLEVHLSLSGNLSPKADPKAAFDSFKFQPDIWYHIALVYSRPTTAKSKTVTVTLYVDSRIVQTLSFRDCAQDDPAVCDMRGFLGTPPQHASSRARSWSLGPVFFFASVLVNADINVMYSKGQTYKGTFARNSLKPRPVSVDSSWLNAGSPSTAVELELEECLSVDADRLIFSFHPHHKFDLAQLQDAMIRMEHSAMLEKKIALYGDTGTSVALPEEMEQLISVVESTDVGVVLANSDSPTLPFSGPYAYLTGGCGSIASLNVADALRMMGGVSALFPMVQQAPSSAELELALTMIVVLVHQNRRNLIDMASQHGYPMLGHILKEKAVLLNESIVNLLFSLVEGRRPLGSRLFKSSKITAETQILLYACQDQGVGVTSVTCTPANAIVANTLALQYLLLDYQIWRCTPPRLQKHLFTRLSHLISSGPATNFLPEVIQSPTKLSPHKPKRLSRMSSFRGHNPASKHPATAAAANGRLPRWNSTRVKQMRIWHSIIHTMADPILPSEVVPAIAGLCRALLADEMDEDELRDLAAYFVMGLGLQEDLDSAKQVHTHAKLLKTQAGLGNDSEISAFRSGYLRRSSSTSDDPSSVPASVKMAASLICIFLDLVRAPDKFPDAQASLSRVFDLHWAELFMWNDSHPLIITMTTRWVCTLLCVYPKFKETFLMAPEANDGLDQRISPCGSKGFNRLYQRLPFSNCSWEVYHDLLYALLGKPPLADLELEVWSSEFNLHLLSQTLLVRQPVTSPSSKTKMSGGSNMLVYKEFLTILIAAVNRTAISVKADAKPELNVPPESLSHLQLEINQFCKATTAFLGFLEQLYLNSEDFQAVVGGGGHLESLAETIFIFQSWFFKDDEILPHLAPENLYSDCPRSSILESPLLSQEPSPQVTPVTPGRQLQVSPPEHKCELSDRPPLYTRAHTSPSELRGSVNQYLCSPTPVSSSLADQQVALDIAVGGEMESVFSKAVLEQMKGRCHGVIESTCNFLTTVIVGTLQQSKTTIVVAEHKAIQLTLGSVLKHASRIQRMSFCSKIIAGVLRSFDVCLCNQDAMSSPILLGNITSFFGYLVNQIESGRLKFEQLHHSHIRFSDIFDFGTRFLVLVDEQCEQDRQKGGSKGTPMKGTSFFSFSKKSKQVDTSTELLKQQLQKSLQSLAIYLLTVFSADPQNLMLTYKAVVQNTDLLFAYDRSTMESAEHKQVSDFIWYLCYHLSRVIDHEDAELRRVSYYVWQAVIQTNPQLAQDMLSSQLENGETLSLIAGGFGHLLADDVTAFDSWLQRSLESVITVLKLTVVPVWSKRRLELSRLRLEQKMTDSKRQKVLAQARQSTDLEMSNWRKLQVIARMDLAFRIQKREKLRQTTFKRDVFALNQQTKQKLKELYSRLQRQSTVFENLGVTFNRFKGLPVPTCRWKLDFTEGPNRQRKRLERFDNFYEVYNMDTTDLDRMLEEPNRSDDDICSERPAVQQAKVAADVGVGDEEETERLQSPSYFDIDAGQLTINKKSLLATKRSFSKSSNGASDDFGDDDSDDSAPDDVHEISESFDYAPENRDPSVLSLSRKSLYDQDDDEDGNPEDDFNAHGVAGDTTERLRAENAKQRNLRFIIERANKKSPLMVVSPSSETRSPHPLAVPFHLPVGKKSADGSHATPRASSEDGNERAERFSQNDILDQDEVEEGRMHATDDAIVEEEETIGEYERICRMLTPGDEILEMYSCSRVNQLDIVSVVVVLCRSNLYIVDNYRITADGVLQEVDPKIPKSGDVGLVRFLACLDKREKADTATHETSNSQVSAGGPKLEHELVLKVRKLKKEEEKEREKLNVKDELHAYSQLAFSSMRELHKRRYQLQNVGIELFYMNGSNFLLVFESPAERNDIYNKLMTMTIPNGMFMQSLSSEVGVKVKQNLQNEKLLLKRWRKQVQKMWVKGELSNFAYLMVLNTLAGRSYSDLTQYPVFPWVLADYTSDKLDLSDPRVYRDLTKPMGALNPERAADFQARYDAWEDPMGIVPKFHYGTHYSSAATVVYYLLRLEPFTKIHLQLQGGRFDHADRLYYDVHHTWRSASSAGGMSDVKELIPEFFYLPEFLENRNKFDMGEHQQGGYVGDVKLPPWAHGDARIFIRQNRKALESEYVSANLHHWIDLIFGYKQRGKPAQEAQNCFYYLTYEGVVDVNAIEDPVEKMATIAQINNFGQTPTQLFRKPHPQRQKMAPPPTIATHTYLLRPHLDKQVRTPQSVCDMGFLRGKIVVVDGSKIVIPNRAKYFSWGHVDGSMRLQALSLSSKPVRSRQAHEIISVYEGLHDGQMTKAIVTGDGHRVVTGGDDGLIKVWSFTQKNNMLLPVASPLCAHVAPITVLVACTSYRCTLYSQCKRVSTVASYIAMTPFYLPTVKHSYRPSPSVSFTNHFLSFSQNSVLVSGGADGQVVIWDLNRLDLIRRLPTHPGPVAGIGIHPSSGLIVTCADANIYVWSMNGELVAEETISESSNDFIHSVALSMTPEWIDETMIITGHRDGCLRFFRLVLLTDSQSSRQPLKRPSILEPSKARTGYSVSPRAKQVSISEMSSIMSSTHETPSINQESAIESDVFTPEPNAMFSCASDTEFDTDDVDDGPYYKNPYMCLALVDLRDNLHTCPVTCIYTPGSNPGWSGGNAGEGKKKLSWERLWTGDQSGLVVPWALSYDSHWQRDSMALACMQCGYKFTTVYRRHHCRNCGHVLCSTCTSKRIPVLNLGYKKPVRVCDRCYVRLTEPVGGVKKMKRKVLGLASKSS